MYVSSCPVLYRKGFFSVTIFKEKKKQMAAPTGPGPDDKIFLKFALYIFLR